MVRDFRDLARARINELQLQLQLHDSGGTNTGGRVTFLGGRGNTNTNTNANTGAGAGAGAGAASGAAREAASFIEQFVRDGRRNLPKKLANIANGKGGKSQFYSVDWPKVRDVLLLAPTTPNTQTIPIPIRARASGSGVIEMMIGLEPAPEVMIEPEGALKARLELVKLCTENGTTNAHAHAHAPRRPHPSTLTPHPLPLTIKPRPSLSPQVWCPKKSTLIFGARSNWLYQLHGQRQSTELTTDTRTARIVVKVAAAKATERGRLGTRMGMGMGIVSAIS